MFGIVAQSRALREKVRGARVHATGAKAARERPSGNSKSPRVGVMGLGHYIMLKMPLLLYSSYSYNEFLVRKKETKQPEKQT